MKYLTTKNCHASASWHPAKAPPGAIYLRWIPACAGMTIALLFTCLLPLPVRASVTLANCDNEPHEVIVTNGSAKRIVTITKYSGKIEEFGPPEMISFQLKDKPKDKSAAQPIVHPLGPDHEFCIWSGRIRTQRLDPGRSFRGGSAF